MCKKAVKKSPFLMMYFVIAQKMYDKVILEVGGMLSFILDNCSHALKFYGLLCDLKNV